MYNVHNVSSRRIGCHIGGGAVNISAYANDIVLLAPAWAALQDLILLVSRCCQDLGLTFNVKKSKCMIINPVDKKKIVSTSFPQFIIDGQCMQFVSEFRYLGHVLTDNLHDDADIKREIRNMYMRTNVLIQRFSRCSQHVKVFPMLNETETTATGVGFSHRHKHDADPVKQNALRDGVVTVVCLSVDLSWLLISYLLHFA